MDWNLQEAITYYRTQGAPRDQNALISLLREIRQEVGCIRQADIGLIVSSYEMPRSVLLALIKRIPGLRVDDMHVLELCGGPNCGKHTQLAAFAQRQNGKKLTVKYVPCMRLCGKGPNIRLDGAVYHKADEALLRDLLEKAGIEVKA